MGEILVAFGVDWRLIAIQVFNFTLLMAFLWYFLYKPILTILKERQGVIEKGVRDAQAAEDALKRADNDKRRILTQAEKEADLVHAKAKQHADEQASGIIHQAKERSERMLKDAEMKGEDIKKEATKESEAELAKIAILAAEKILQEKGP